MPTAGFGAVASNLGFFSSSQFCFLALDEQAHRVIAQELRAVFLLTNQKSFLQVSSLKRQLDADPVLKVIVENLPANCHFDFAGLGAKLGIELSVWFNKSLLTPGRELFGVHSREHNRVKYIVYRGHLQPEGSIDNFGALDDVGPDRRRTARRKLGLLDEQPAAAAVSPDDATVESTQSTDTARKTARGSGDPEKARMRWTGERSPHNVEEKRPRSRLYDSDDPAPAKPASSRDELRSKLERRVSELRGAFDTERGRANHLEATLDARTKVAAELQSVLVNLKQFELERNLKHLAGPPGGPGSIYLCAHSAILGDIDCRPRPGAAQRMPTSK